MLSKKAQTKSNRLKPKYSGKNKKTITGEDIDELDKNIVVRYSKEDFKKRQDFVLEIGNCQVCGLYKDLDAPHHAVYGLGKKDDRFIVNICLECHRIIHSGSYEDLYKTRKELEVIGWKNHLNYLSSI